jgi:plastocyanin
LSDLAKLARRLNWGEGMPILRTIPKLVASLTLPALLASGCLSQFGAPGGGTPQQPAPGPQSPNSNRGGDSTGPIDPGGGGGGGGGGGTSVVADMAPPAPLPDLAGPPASTGTLSLSLPSTSESLRLNESKDITVTVTPSAGFSGMVTYAVDNLPAGVTATFDPPAAMVTAPTTTKLTLKTSSSMKPNNALAMQVKATSGAISAPPQPLTLDVKAELLVTIPNGVKVGTNAAPNLEAFGAQTIETVFVAPGTKITFVNADAINHQIHSDGTLGVAHEGGPLMANGGNAYTQTLNGTGTLNFRCHIHPGMRGQIVVKAAQ